METAFFFKIFYALFGIEKHTRPIFVLLLDSCLLLLKT